MVHMITGGHQLKRARIVILPLRSAWLSKNECMTQVFPIPHSYVLLVMAVSMVELEARSFSRNTFRAAFSSSLLRSHPSLSSYRFIWSKFFTISHTWSLSIIFYSLLSYMTLRHPTSFTPNLYLQSFFYHCYVFFLL
ncbi:hypothetical protein K469DRAFT_140238 [Zopfia rhizophila CBS 207.26]|uniref:Uncharacterized protein n=1 Tax=Zopfia rhizophila CBS 207.26 TaxID=1314779 RepID=A0A6A6E3S6_9PEZI|nr:hypothetical protein K469DRAFT_140238 [Zopfia rhizophila CBS 207.26]